MSSNFVYNMNSIHNNPFDYDTGFNVGALQRTTALTNQIMANDERLQQNIKDWEAREERRRRLEEEVRSKRSGDASKMAAVMGGQADLDSAMIKIPTPEGFIWRNYDEGKDALSRTTHMNNTVTLAGPNEYAHRNRFYGTAPYLQMLEEFNQQGVEDARAFLDEQGISTLRENPDEYRILESMVGTAKGLAANTVEVFSGDDPSWGATRFQEGGEIYQELYEVDPNWKDSQAMDNTIASLLDPETSRGQMFRQMGLKEGDIRRSPNIMALSVVLNKMATDYEAGQAAAEMSAGEKVWQFVADTGVGMVTDPDTVLEIAATAVLAPFTKGGSVALYAGTKMGQMGVKVAARAPRMAKFYRAMDVGATTLGNSLKVVGTVPKKFLPTTIAEQLIVPAVARASVIRRGLQGSDEVAMMAKQVSQSSTGSLMTSALGRTIFTTDVTPGTLMQGLTGNMIDGAVGELFAYGLSREEEYNWNRFVSGEYVNRDEFDSTWWGYAQSGLMGMGFGVAIGGAMRIGTNVMMGSTGTGARIQGGLEAAQAADGGVFESMAAFKRGWSEAFGAQRDASAAQAVGQLWADATGRSQIDLAKSHVTGMARKNGITEPDKLEELEMLVEHAWNSGVDLATFSKKLSRTSNLKDIPRLLGELIDTPESKKRAAAVRELNVVSSSEDAAKVIEGRSAIARKVTTRQVETAIESNELVSDTSSLKALKELAEEGDEDAKAFIEELKATAMMSSRSIVSFLIRNRNSATPAMLTDIADGMLIRQGREALTVEERVKLTEMFKRRQDRVDAVQESDEARYQKTLETGVRQEDDGESLSQIDIESAREVYSIFGNKFDAEMKLNDPQGVHAAAMTVAPEMTTAEATGAILASKGRDAQERLDMAAKERAEISDARLENSVYDVEYMIRETEARLAKFKEAYGVESVEVEPEDFAGKTRREIASSILDDFGIDVGEVDKGDEIAKVSAASRDELVKLYNQLAILKKMSTDNPKLLEAQTDIAKSLVEGITAMNEQAARAGYPSSKIDVSFAVRFMPPGYANLLTNLFERHAGYRDNGQMYIDGDKAYDLALSIYDDAVLGSDILNRTRDEVAAENKGSPFILVANKYYHGRSLRLRKGAAEAETARAMEKRAGDKFDQTRGDESVDAYVARHEALFVEGVVDAWSAIAPGPAKDALARRLGIYGVVTRNNELFAEGPKRNKARTEADAKALAAKINKYYKETYGIESIQLINGELDAVDGYTAGRAMIEAVSPLSVGTKDGDAFAEGLDNAPRRGWLGTGSTSSIQKVHEDAVRDQVIGQLFFQDGEFNTPREQLEPDKIFAYYEEIQSEIDELKRNNYPEEATQAFIKKYMSATFYEPYRQRYFAPQQMIRQVEEKLGSFRERVQRRTDQLMNANPAIVKTLHDEVAGPRNFFGQLAIVGNIMGGKEGKAASQYMDGLSGDMGLEGASVMPGSFKHAWQIRTGKMFGTTKGLSKLAAAAGLKDFSSWAEGRSEEEVVRLMKDMDAFKIDGEFAQTAVDASAQAVTAAQSLYRDWAINNWDILTKEQQEGLNSQREFTQWLSEVRPFLNTHGGIDAMAETLVKYNTYTTDKGPDNYSKVGFEALAKSNNPDWKFLEAAMLENQPDGSTTLKTAGSLGNFLRKEIFKSPVMTLPYSAGMGAFRNALTNGLNKLKQDPGKYGFEGADVDKIRAMNVSNMANAMAISLYGQGDEPGLIQTVLDIPRSNDMVKNIEMNNALSVVLPDGTVFEIDGRMLANGTWESNPTLVEHIRNKARQVFQVEDPATQMSLGEWYVTMMFERQNNSNVRPNIDAEIDALKKYVATPPEERGSWDAVSSYMGTAELAGRIGYTAVKEQVDLMLKATGLSLNDLSNEAMVQLMGKAVYFPKGSGFSRAFAGSDTAQAGRDMSTATEGEEASPADGGPEVNVGQYRLVDMREGLAVANRRAVSREDTERAVLQDEIINASSIFQLPNDLRPSQQVSMDDLIGQSREPETVDRRTAIQANMEANLARFDVLEAKRREFEKSGEELPLDEAQEYAFLYQMKKMLIEEKDDGSTRVNTNDILIASDKKPALRLTQPEGSTVGKSHPTKLGVPALREIQQKELAETTSVSSDGLPISISDMVVASPYSLQWRSAQAEKEVDIPSIEDDNIAAAARGDDKVIKQRKATAEIEADDSQAASLGTDRSSLVAYRMNRRAGNMHYPRVAGTRSRAAKGEATEAQVNSAVQASEIALAEALQATFGININDSTSNLNYVPTSSADVVPGMQGLTALGAVQRFAAKNRKHRMLGLSLGAVSHAGLRLANPKVDGDSQVSNRVAKVTSRGPASIFYRDWSLMGGAQVDAVANMIDYAVARMDSDMDTAAKYEQVRKDIAEQGVYEWWANTRANAVEGDIETQLEDLMNFTEKNLGSAMNKDAIDAAMADFNSKFERGLQIHGINPRTAVDIDGEEKMLLVSIIDSLSDETMMSWFKDAMGITEDITPEEVALAFASPDTQKKMMFLRPYEIVESEDGTERVYNPFGDIINGQHVVDPQMAKDSRPVFTEMNLLNLLNATGNRRLMRRIVLANEFGVDIPMNLTGSQSTANPPQAGFDGTQPPTHGFWSTPRNEAEATLVREGVEWNGNKTGKMLVKRADSILSKPLNRAVKVGGKRKTVPYTYYAVADMLINFGLTKRTERGVIFASQKAKKIAEVLLGYEVEPEFMDAAFSGMARVKAVDTNKAVQVKKQAAQAKRTAELAAKNEAESARIPETPVEEAPAAKPEAPAAKPEGESGSDADVDNDSVGAAMARLGGDNLSTQEASKPIEKQHIVDTPSKYSSQGASYLKDLVDAYNETGDVMWKNQISAFKDLTEGPNAISDIQAIVLLEQIVKNDKMRRAFWGGGDIGMRDEGEQVQMAVGFGSDIKARLEGLSHVKRAVKNDNIPVAAFVLMHELTERMLAVVQYDKSAGRERSDSLKKLRNQVMKDFIDDAGWNTGTRPWLEATIGKGISRKVEGMRAQIMADIKADPKVQNDPAVQEAKSEKSGYKNVPKGVLNKMANAVSNLFTYAANAGQEGRSAQDKRRAATELMAQWLTIVAYRSPSDKGHRPNVAAGIWQDIGPSLRDADDIITHKVVNEVKNPSDNSRRRARLRNDPTPEINRDDTRGFDDSALRGAVAYANVDGTYFKQMSDTFDLIADRAISIYEGDVIPEVVTDETTNGYSVVVRPLGGKEGEVVSSSDLEAMKTELKDLETGSTDWMQLYGKIKRTESALFTYTGEEVITREEEFMNLDIKSKFDPEKENPDDVGDLRRLTPQERSRYITLQTDKLLSTFNVAKSGRAGSAYIGAGSFLTATPGALEGNTSDIMAVRSMAAMLDTTNFNTEGTVRGYVPVQMAVDKLQSRFAGIREVLGPVRKKMRKMRKGKLDNSVVRRVERIILAAVDTGNFDNLDALSELTPKEKAAVKQYHHKMMNKDTGFIRNLIDAAEQDGMMNATQAANLRAKPRLPYQLDRSFLDDANNFVDVRSDVRGAMVRNQLAALALKDRPPIWDANMAREAGVIFDESLDDAQFRHIAQELDPQSSKAWDSVVEALGLKTEGKAQWELIKEANGIIIEYLHTNNKKKYPKEFMRSMSQLTEIFRSRLISNKAPKVILSEGRAVTPSQYMKYQSDIRNKDTEGRQTVVHEADTSIGMFGAHKIVQNWRNGGYLRGDTMLFKDPRTPKGAKDLGHPDWLEMQVSDVSVLTNGLFGSSRIIESYHAAVNQNILGAKGLRFEDMYFNLLSRIKGGQTVPVSRGADGKVVSRALTSNEARVAVTALKALKDQYDSGIGRLPEGVESPGKVMRNINALVRIGTSIGSAPNWAISSLAETTQLVMQTMMRTVMLRDLKAVFDFIAPLGKETRKQLYESVNMFHNQYDRHNIGIQTGQYFLGDISDLDRTDSSEQIALEKLDGWLRWVGTLGFGSMNRYNRYVGASRAARDLRRLANKPGFLKFNKWLKENPDASVKEAVAAGRPLGVNRENATLLTLSGFGDGSGYYVQEILRNMTDYAGVRWADVERGKRKLLEGGHTGDLANYQKAATLVSTMLQQKNQYINLEPRMGSKSVPKTVTESAIASLSQFPVLAMMNLRRIAKVGGIAGVSSYMMYLIMGDTVYESLKGVLLKGETPESIMEKWEEDPYGQTLTALQRSALMGGPMGEGVKDMLLASSAQMIRYMSDNEAAVSSYRSKFAQLGGNVAGASMLFSNAGDLIEGLDKMGDNENIGHDILSSLPGIPVRPLVTYTVGQLAQNTTFASIFDAPEPRTSGGSRGSRAKPISNRTEASRSSEVGMAPPEAQSRPEVSSPTQKAEMPETKPEGFTEGGASSDLADRQ